MSKIIHPARSERARSGPKIGVLVPFTNVNLEPDMQLLCPSGSSMHFARLSGYDADEIPGSDQMAGLGSSDITEELKLICGVRPSVVIYGCTSATLTHGLSFDQSLAHKIEATAGVPSLTAAGCVVHAIETLGVRHIGFASPYLGEINNQAISFFENRGINTVSRRDIGRELGNYGQGELTPDEVLELGKQADCADAEAIVLSCTDMRSVEIIGQLEVELGKPVVTSNQAIAFGIYQVLKMPNPGSRFIEKYGRIFSYL